MRWSRYNHLFSSLQYGDFIYNSVTNSFVKIEKGLSSQLKNVTEWNESSMSGTFLHVPAREDIPENIKEQLIVELYSK